MLDATMTSMMNTSKRGNVTMAWIPTRNEFSLKKEAMISFSGKVANLPLWNYHFLMKISVSYMHNECNKVSMKTAVLCAMTLFNYQFGSSEPWVP